KTSVRGSGGQAGRQRGLVHEGECDAVDDYDARRRHYWAESSRSYESREFRDVEVYARDAYATHQRAVLEERHATWIYGVGLAVIQIRFSGQDALPGLRSIDGAGGRHRLTRNKIGIEPATAIGVLNSVEGGVAGEHDSGRKMNAA